jgi:hypothetical protein
MTQICDISSDRPLNLRNLSNARFKSGTRNGRFAPIVLKKSANRPFATTPRGKRAWALLWLGGLQRRARDELCELPEILGGSRQEELVSSTQWASQPETVEAQDALQVRE